MILSFRDAPIRKKIVAIILLTSGLVVFGSVVLFGVNEVITFREETRKNLESTGTLIGNNSVAAIMSRDPKVANEALASLGKNEAILSAYLLTGHLEILAGSGRS